MFVETDRMVLQRLTENEPYRVVTSAAETTGLPGPTASLRVACTRCLILLTSALRAGSGALNRPQHPRVRLAV